MKKITLAIVLVTALMVAGFAGVADGAPPQQAMDRGKLVGVGQNGFVRVYGLGPDPVDHWYSTYFIITNPHPEDIYIDGLVLRRSNGNVVYEGPLLHVILWTDYDNRVIDVGVVTDRYEIGGLICFPSYHHTVTVILHQYMPDGEGGFLGHMEAANLFLDSYTVEISYRAPRGLQLMGTTTTYDQSVTMLGLPGERWMEGRSSTPMVNIELGQVGGGGPASQAAQ
jgi:hypothetical protein